MKEDIKWLIEKYQDEIERLDEERKNCRTSGFGDAMAAGKIGAYTRVVNELTELLEDEENDE